MKPELSYLAHHANSIDKYREETCCVIGQTALSDNCHIYTQFLLTAFQTILMVLVGKN